MGALQLQGIEQINVSTVYGKLGGTLTPDFESGAIVATPIQTAVMRGRLINSVWEHSFVSLSTITTRAD